MPGPNRLALAALIVMASAATAAAKEYSVAITTEPDGAEVYIDDTEGEPIGTTPFTAKLEPGDYTLIIERKGYEPAVESLTVTKSRRQKLSLELTKQATGSLVLSPAEAGEDFEDSTILIDGVEKSVTKGEPIDVPVGAHQVEVVRKGYKTYEAWIEVKEGGTNTVTVNFVEGGDDDDDDDDGFGGGEVKKKKPEGGGGPPPDLSGNEQFQLTAGIEYGGRILRYPADSTVMIREEYTLLASRLRLAGAAYPLARKSKSLAGLGLGATLGFLVFPRTSSTTNGGSEVSTNWFDFAIDLRYRYAFSDKLYLMGSLGYALETFSFGQDANLGDSLSPASYKQIEVGAMVGAKLGTVQTYFGLSLPYVTGAGEFADGRFEGPAITAFGITAGGYKRLYKQLDLVVHVTYSYYSIKFGTPIDPAIDAVSAVDQYFGLMAGVGYRM